MGDSAESSETEARQVVGRGRQEWRRSILRCITHHGTLSVNLETAAFRNLPVRLQFGPQYYQLPPDEVHHLTCYGQIRLDQDPGHGSNVGGARHTEGSRIWNRTRFWSCSYADDICLILQPFICPERGLRYHDEVSRSQPDRPQVTTNVLKVAHRVHQWKTNLGRCYRLQLRGEGVPLGGTGDNRPAHDCDWLCSVDLESWSVRVGSECHIQMPTSLNYNCSHNRESAF